MAPNPDNLSAFAAQRTTGGALTVMVISKGFDRRHTGDAESGSLHGQWNRIAAYQLTAPPLEGNPPKPAPAVIKHLANVTWSGGKLSATVPAQSITLFVLP